MPRKIISILLAVMVLLSWLTACAKVEADDGIMSVLSEREGQPNPSAIAEPEPSEAESEPAEDEPEPSDDADSLWRQYDPDANMNYVLKNRPENQLPLAQNGEELTFWCRASESGARGDSLAAEKMAELTGVEVSYITTASPQTDFGLMRAGGQFYDILEGCQEFADTDWLLDNNAVLEISGMIDDCCPCISKIMKADCLYGQDMLTDNGRMAGIAEYTYNNLTTNGAALRRDWLTELKLDDPTTLEDFHRYLSAVKSTGLCDAPLVLNYDQITGGLLTSAFGCRVADDPLESFFFDGDGELVFGWTDSSFREYLAEMSRWYAEGLISFESLDDGQILAGHTALFSTDVYSLDTLNSQGTGGFYAEGCYEPVGEGSVLSQKLPHYVPSTFVSTSCENSELALKWLDWHFSVEGSMLCVFGQEDVSRKYDRYALPHYTELVLSNPDGLTASQALEKYALPDELCLHDITADYELFNQCQTASVYRWGYERQVDRTSFICRIRLPDEVQREVDDLFAAIVEYARTAVWQFVTGRADMLSGWSDYLKKVGELGGDRIYEIVSAAGVGVFE